MAGVLSFALGLETSAFSSALDRAGGRLLAFASVGKIVSETMDGVFGAIDRAGKLQDLSARTGESVATLYQLEEAFKVVGISTDALPGMINKFNKSLSGIGEMGEKTSDAFAALGLSTEDLKKMDAPAQLAAVSEKLGQLDKGSAFDIASRLFGREGAANIMQISRDFSSFNETLVKSQRGASVFARMAPDADKLGDTVTQLKSKIGTMFAGIGEGMLPALQRGADYLETMDLTGFGERIGREISMAFAAADLGKFSEYFDLVLKAGVQDMANLLAQKLAETYAAGAGADYIDLAGKAGKVALPLIGSTGGVWGMAAQVTGMLDLAEKFADPIKRGAMGLENQYRDSLGKMQLDFASRVSDSEINALAWDYLNPDNWNFDTPQKKQIAEKLPEPRITDLEKMGFVFNGGGALDTGKQTANNTRMLVQIGNEMLKNSKSYKYPQLYNA